MIKYLTPLFMLLSCIHFHPVPCIGQETDARTALNVEKLQVTILSTMLADTKGIGEWGFSALVEVDGRKILFDTELRPETVSINCKELGIDLSDVSEVILSHHHGDHTGGLLTLRREFMKQNPKALSRVYVGKGLFLSRPDGTGKETNEIVDQKAAFEATGGEFVEVGQITAIAPGAFLTGPVLRTYPERNWSGRSKIATATGLVEDTLPEDMALIINTEKGLVAINGCGHAGIVNTLEYAVKSICPAPVHAVIGGLHLFPSDDKNLDWTAGKLKELKVANLVGAHCTGIEAVYRLRQGLGLKRETCVVGAVGSGFSLDQGIRPGTIAH